MQENLRPSHFCPHAPMSTTLFISAIAILYVIGFVVWLTEHYENGSIKAIMCVCTILSLVVLEFAICVWLIANFLTSSF